MHTYIDIETIGLHETRTFLSSLHDVQMLFRAKWGARSFHRPEEGRSILLLEEPSVVEIEARVSAAAVKKGIWPVRTAPEAVL